MRVRGILVRAPLPSEMPKMGEGGGEENLAYTFI